MILTLVKINIICKITVNLFKIKNLFFLLIYSEDYYGDVDLKTLRKIGYRR